MMIELVTFYFGGGFSHGEDSNPKTVRAVKLGDDNTYYSFYCDY